VIVEPAPHLHSTVIQLLKDEYKLTDQRTGMHVSDLTHCLTLSYWNRVDPAPPSDEGVVMWSIGWGLERVLIPRLHVEPLEVDGITGTPDFAFPDGTPADLKSTRMATSTSAGCAQCGEPYVGHSKGKNGHVYEKAPAVPFVIPETWKRQFMAYRYMINAHATAHRSHTWAQEHYGRSFGVVVVHLIPAEIRCYTLYFTEGELAAHWDWMLDRANTLESMLAADDPMPFTWNEPWECEHCAHSLKCGLEASLRQGGKSGA
jgi:hypothetical protein